jgi:cytochrome c peroxidase
MRTRPYNLRSLRFVPNGTLVTAIALSGGVLSCHELGDSKPTQGKSKRTTTSIVNGSVELGIVAQSAAPAAEHCEEAVADREFDDAFECGDELFETVFNELDGVGANVGQGQRFTRFPRADLRGAGEWFNHTPARITGPNAQACNDCHRQPFDDGAGPIGGNVHRDPLRAGVMAQFIQRNTPHVFAPGAVQRTAEEMTDALMALRQAAQTAACQLGGTRTRTLTAKGVNFGTISATRTGLNPCTVTFNTAGVVGVATDLIVRPFQWKGSVAFVRDFNRGASHNELGMQPVELTGDGVDGDGDGVADELSIADQTALAVYLSAQPRPVTKIELADLGLMELTADERAAIGRGQTLFGQVGCATCHVPSMTVNNPIFSEPSQSAFYRDATFPAGQNPVASGVDPADPITFNLTSDQPDNVIDIGGTEVHLGSLEANAAGGGIVRLFGDLKRHNIGTRLAETVDEVGTGASVFLTENLWGVGSTAPYLHDGRATTLASAILEHGGEAQTSRNNFVALTAAQQGDLVAFLNNLILFKQEEEAAPEGGVTATLRLDTSWTSGDNGTGGYCQTILVTNNGTAPTTSWSVGIALDGTTIYTSWNGTFTGSTGNASVTPCCSWNSVIQPGETQQSVGFCARRNTGTLASVIATVQSASGSF